MSFSNPIKKRWTDGKVGLNDWIVLHGILPIEMFEIRSAVEQLDVILGGSGLGAVYVGPTDLSLV
jgi:2-keto-3-deoxy-L-rhamnonate aldolase RhmA